jgi:hypothetical protein
MTDETAEQRYRRDPLFANLVDTILHFILDGKFTPTELRDAVILAATHYEMRHVRPQLLFSEDFEWIYSKKLKED